MNHTSDDVLILDVEVINAKSLSNYEANCSTSAEVAVPFFLLFFLSGHVAA